MTKGTGCDPMAALKLQAVTRTIIVVSNNSKLGIAQLEADADEQNVFSSWSLTMFGHMSGKPLMSWAKPMLVMDTAREEKKCLKMTVIDCIQLLLDAEWVPHSDASVEKVGKRKLETKGSKPQVLYLSENDTQRLWYLRLASRRCSKT